MARHWSRQDRREDREHDEIAARRAEVDRRTDAAAVEALDELQRLRELYASKGVHDDLPDEAAILRRLERSSLLIRGPGQAPLMDVVRPLRRADKIGASDLSGVWV